MIDMRAVMERGSSLLYCVSVPPKETRRGEARQGQRGKRIAACLPPSQNRLRRFYFGSPSLSVRQASLRQLYPSLSKDLSGSQLHLPVS